MAPLVPTRIAYALSPSVVKGRLSGLSTGDGIPARLGGGIPQVRLGWLVETEPGLPMGKPVGWGSSW